MAELADALDLGSSAVKGVQVQVLFPAPTKHLCGFSLCNSASPVVKVLNLTTGAQSYTEKSHIILRTQN